MRRFNHVLPACTYHQLNDQERQRLLRTIEHLHAYIDMVESEQRDLEVAFGKSHPDRPESVRDTEDYRVTPSLRSQFDTEIDRRNSSSGASHQQQRATSRICPDCETDRYITPTIENSSVRRCRQASAKLTNGHRRSALIVAMF